MLKNFFLKVFMVAFSCAFSILFIEVAVRMFAPQPKYYNLRYLFAADKELGYKLNPNFRGKMSTPETTVTIEINAKGLGVVNIRPAVKPPFWAW